jgi:hypothetical protein
MRSGRKRIAAKHTFIISDSLGSLFDAVSENLDALLEGRVMLTKPNKNNFEELLCSFPFYIKISIITVYITLY